VATESGPVPMSTFSIRIPTAIKEQLDLIASSSRRSRNFLLTEAVERYLDLYARQLAHIEEGLADLDASRVHDHDEMRELVSEFERLAREDATR
jgi:RHH-type rel operon transcriptional repressor/antitoxin RelB